MTTEQRLQKIEQRLKRVEAILTQKIVLPEPLPEDRQWMEANSGSLSELEPYDWGPEGPPQGQPVHYDHQLGWVVEGDE